MGKKSKKYQGSFDEDGVRRYSVTHHGTRFNVVHEDNGWWEVRLASDDTMVRCGRNHPPSDKKVAKRCAAWADGYHEGKRVGFEQGREMARFIFREAVGVPHPIAKPSAEPVINGGRVVFSSDGMEFRLHELDGGRWDIVLGAGRIVSWGHGNPPKQKAIDKYCEAWLGGHGVGRVSGRSDGMDHMKKAARELLGVE